MKICYLDIVRTVTGPAEAYSPPIVDSDTVLTFSNPRQSLQPVSWRYSKVLYRIRCVEHRQLPLSNTLDIRWKPMRPLS